MEQEKITLTKSELKKALIIGNVIQRHLTVKEAAELLELSTRQVLRLKKVFINEGPQGLAHKNRGRKPTHTLSDKIKNKVAKLYQGDYYKCNNTHFSELLEERESIKISPSSVRRILLEKGLKQNKSRRKGSVHKPRERKTQEGMLWQIDASKHAWLEERGPELTLHGAIDDATGKVVGAVFRFTETREGYFDVMRQGIGTYGIPQGLYSDQHTIFRSPKEKITLEQELAGERIPLSQFGKAMDELEITHIKALTPEAKGRIERLWGTFQDRLIIELRLLRVTTLEEANQVLPQLIEKHNQRFSVVPVDETSAYRALNEINLTYVFAIREKRRIGPGQTLSYRGKTYTVASNNAKIFKLRATVEVRETLQGDVVIYDQGNVLTLREVNKPTLNTPTKKEKTEQKQPRKPTTNHPWKQPQKQRLRQANYDKNEFEEVMYSQHNSYAEGSW